MNSLRGGLGLFEIYFDFNLEKSLQIELPITQTPFKWFFFQIKGEEMVSAKHSSAFAIAAVTVGLISDHPDLIPLLLGHFNRLCPYTVPYHVNKEEGQSMEDYLKYVYYMYKMYSQTCIKRSLLGERKSGLIRQVTS
jgi:hypothetical protein